MKKPLISALALALVTMAVSAQPSPRYGERPDGMPQPVFAPMPGIYHDGWIDFNKNGRKDVYEDPTADIDARIEDLLAQMTLDEKTMQLATLYGYGKVLKDPLPTVEWKHQLWKDGIANIDEMHNGCLRYADHHPYATHQEQHIWAINETQRFFIEQTRLGIPADMSNEGIRGLKAYAATSFPSQLGLGHTWNPELIREVGKITGREARALGYTNVYAPILDVARDQRWGRMEEVYGESPFLASRLGVAMVKGLQHDAGVASTAKHFVVYSANKGAREHMARTDPQVAPREVEEIHLAPFAAAIREAGMLGVMSSYNDYDGVPITGSQYWLTRRLRDELGFRGYVVSDSDAVEFLHTKHAVAKDAADAAAQAINAGLNVRTTFSPPDDFVLPLRSALQQGLVNEATIDARVRDVLRVKFWQGLFDTPYTDARRSQDIVGAAAHRDVARQAAYESLVLLKNDNNALPLSKTLRTVAVIGPNADDAGHVRCHYGPSGGHTVTVLEGVRNVLGDQVNIRHAKGVEASGKNWPQIEAIPQTLSAEEQAGIDAAVLAATGADVAIVVLGDGKETIGESRTRTSLELPGRQRELLRAVHATGTPVVLVLINGRPPSINWADQHVPAILEAWFPGHDGGNAIAKALFGDLNPGGKLTVTFPRSVGQLPYNFPTKPNAQFEQEPSRINGALYHFGHGLSYTTFAYDNLRINPQQVPAGENVTVSVDVRNTGARAGDEVVQLYTRDVVSSVTTYEKNLRGFERIHLAPGEQRTLHFTLTPEHLKLWNRQMQHVVEPGVFKVMLGSSSEDIRQHGEFEVLP